MREVATVAAQLAATVRLDTVKSEDFDTVFYPGGHGPMWDLAEDQNSVKLIWARSGEYVTQVTGIGPLGIAYVDPKNDARNAR